MKITKTISIDLEVEVDGTYRAGSSGSFYRSNGDPGDPPEAPEYEIKSVYFGKHDITKILDEANFDWASLEQDLIEDCENYDAHYDD